MVIARKEPQIELAGKAENTSFRQLVAAAFSFEQSSETATHGQQLGLSRHRRHREWRSASVGSRSDSGHPSTCTT